MCWSSSFSRLIFEWLLSDDGAALVGSIVRLHVMLTIRIGYSSVSKKIFLLTKLEIKMNDLLVWLH